MPESLSSMDLKRLFRFPFQGAKAPERFIAGSALVLGASIIPLVPAIPLGGYLLQVMRRAIDGQEPELPAWDDWGKLIGDGLRVALVGLVYCLPGWIVLLGGMLVYLAGMTLLPIAAVSGTETGETAALASVLMLGSMAILFICTAVGMGLVILATMALPMALAHLAANGRLSDAFRVGHWGRILSTDKLGYFISWIIVSGLLSVMYLGTTLAFYTAILCCLVPVLAAPLSFYISLLAAVLFGQNYRQGAANLSKGAEKSA